MTRIVDKEVSAEAEAMLSASRSNGSAVRSQLSVEAARIQHASSLTALQPEPPLEDGFRPKRILILVHGGGFVVGQPLAVESLARTLRRIEGTVVITPRYRLSPEHPLPFAVDDIVDAIVTARKDFPGIPVFAVGHSAGGYLVLAAATRMAEHLSAPIDGIVMLAPMLDPTLQSNSAAVWSEGALLTTADLRWFWEHALSGGFQPPDLIAALAPFDTRILVVVAERDPLRDDGARFSERAGKLGMNCGFIEIADALHAQMNGRPPAANRLLGKLIGQWVVGD